MMERHRGIDMDPQPWQSPRWGRDDRTTEEAQERSLKKSASRVLMQSRTSNSSRIKSYMCKWRLVLLPVCWGADPKNVRDTFNLANTFTSRHDSRKSGPTPAKDNGTPVLHLAVRVHREKRHRGYTRVCSTMIPDEKSMEFVYYPVSPAPCHWNEVQGLSYKLQWT